MKKTLTAGVLAVLALTTTACGSNEDEAASKAIADSIMKEQKSSESADQFLDMKQKDADCIGDGLVDKIGTEKLQKYGLLTKDNKAKDNVTDVKMSEGDAKSATDVLFGCTDVEGMMKTAMEESGDVPDEMKDCVTKVLTEENLRTMFTQIFNGKQEEAQKTLVQPMMKCAVGSQGQ